MQKELWKYIRNISAILLVTSIIIIAVLCKKVTTVFFVGFTFPTIIEMLLLIPVLALLTLLASLIKLRKMSKTRIRKATENDLDEIMEIISEVQEEMKKDNNPQWNKENDYPNRNKFLSDINNNALYIYEDKVIKGFMAITIDQGDYNDLLKTSNKPAYILHRLAIKKDYRNEGVASKLFQFAEGLAKENNIELLKGDTEKKNIKMNKLFNKLGFVQKGEFEYDDYPGHYNYYEKELNQK